MLCALRGNHARGYKLKSIKEKQNEIMIININNVSNYTFYSDIFFIERQTYVFIFTQYSHISESPCILSCDFFTYFFIISYTCYRGKVKDHFLFLFASTLISFIIILELIQHMLALFKRAIQLRYFLINKTHVSVFSNRNMKKNML